MIILKILGKYMRDFIPIEQMAELEETSLMNLKTLQYKKTAGNDDRFKVIDGKLHIHRNYKAMLKDEIEDLYYKAIIVAGCENKLAIAISQIIGKKKDTVQRYFLRFTFKQVEIAKEIKIAMEKFINENSLFPIEELNYEK